MKTYYKNQLPSRQPQSGFTLIELLVSALLGVFLVAGVITNVMSTKSVDKTRSAVAEMDSKARSAMQILRQTISHAGYRSTKNVRLESPFFSELDDVEENLICNGATRRSAPAAQAGFNYKPTKEQYSKDRNKKGDILTVVYLADNPCVEGVESCEGANNANINPNALVYQDCTGGGATRDKRSVSCSVENMKNPLDAKIYSTFYLQKEPGVGELDDKVLYCRGNRGGPQPLVEGIKNMQFLYGVKDDANVPVDERKTRYFEAKEIVNNDRWGSVVSVRIGLLIQSSEKNIVNATEHTKKKYILLNKKIEVEDLTRLYRVYTTTVNLPNQDIGGLL